MTPRREANDRPHWYSPAVGGSTMVRLSFRGHNLIRSRAAAAGFAAEISGGAAPVRFYGVSITTQSQIVVGCSRSWAHAAGERLFSLQFFAALPLLHAEPGDQNEYHHDHQQPDDAVPLHADAPLAPYQRDVAVRTIRGCDSKINTFFSRVVSSSDIGVFQFVFVALRRGAS